MMPVASSSPTHVALQELGVGVGHPLYSCWTALTLKPSRPPSPGRCETRSSAVHAAGFPSSRRPTTLC